MLIPYEISILTAIITATIAVIARLRFPGFYPYAKPWPVTILILALFAQEASLAGQTWALIALACGLVGDLLLLKPALFLPGLAAFFFGHLCYTGAFWAAIPETASIWTVPWGWFGLVFLIALRYFIYLRPWLRKKASPSLTPAVGSYIGAISVMGLSAMNLAAANRVDAYWDLALQSPVPGALLFMLSDFTLALQKFVIPRLWLQAIILPAYYGAQILLAAHWLR